MELELTEEQRMLKTAASGFLKKECPPALAWEMREDERGYPPSLWQKMIEMGWTGVMVPETYGGIGGGFMDLCVILEALGEVCAPGPFFSTVVLGGLAVMELGTEAQKEALLSRIAAGECIMALAADEEEAWCDASFIKTRGLREAGGYRISGTKLFVENAHVADIILCVVTGPAEGSLSVLLVQGDAPGLRITPLKTLAGERQCEVVFDRVEVKASDVLGEAEKAAPGFDRLLDQAAVAKCAELVGCLQTAFDMTVAYAKEREQFGRPIGSFQAVQHHCADMLIDLDGARFATYQAAWRIAGRMPWSREVAVAKAWTSDVARKVTLKAHQIHGAISFCEEHPLHVFYRKAKSGEVAFGDADFHLERVAGGLGL